MSIALGDTRTQPNGEYDYDHNNDQDGPAHVIYLPSGNPVPVVYGHHRALHLGTQQFTRVEVSAIPPLSIPVVASPIAVAVPGRRRIKPPFTLPVAMIFAGCGFPAALK